MINQLIENGKLTVQDLVGKWETFRIQTISNPFPNIKKALVILGSDKRGTIFGIYDVSERIGVSPCYCWANVPIEHQDALYVKPVEYTKSPCC